MPSNLLNILLMILPLAGLVTTPLVSFLIVTFLLIYLYMNKNYIEGPLIKTKFEKVAILWFLASCFWSVNIVGSLITFIKIFPTIILTYILINDLKKEKKLIVFSNKWLVFSIALPLITLYGDYFSNFNFINSCSGFFFTYATNLIVTEPSSFHPGVAILTLFIWFVIANLTSKNKNITAILLYIVTLLTFLLLNYFIFSFTLLLAGLVFLMTSYWPFHHPKILSFILIICSLGVIFVAIIIKPKKIFEESNLVPTLVKEQLFSWKHDFKNYQLKPIIGYGLDTTKELSTNEIELTDNNGDLVRITYYHNILLQLLLETGLIGLILFLSLLVKYLNSWNLSFKNANTNKITNFRSAGYACFCSFLVTSMLIFSAWETWWIFSYLWVIFLFHLSFLDERSSD